MAKNQIFKSLMSLLSSNKSLNNSFSQLEYDVKADKMRWRDVDGEHSVDIMTFCCKVVLEKLTNLLGILHTYIVDLPTMSDLFWMVKTDLKQYVELMRGIISCV